MSLHSAPRCALCMAAMRWPGCRLLPPHEMASPAAHRALSLAVLLHGQNVLSRSSSGYPSPPQTEEGDGFLAAGPCDRHAGFSAQPVFGGLSSSSTQGHADSLSHLGHPAPHQQTPLCSGGSPASKVLYPSMLPSAKRSLPWAVGSGSRAWHHCQPHCQPHCPELGMLLAPGTPPAPSTISTETGKKPHQRKHNKNPKS